MAGLCKASPATAQRSNPSPLAGEGVAAPAGGHPALRATFSREGRRGPLQDERRGAEKHNFCEPALSGHAIFVSCRATWIESLTHVNVWVAHNFIVFPWSSRIVSRTLPRRWPGKTRANAT